MKDFVTIATYRAAPLADAERLALEEEGIPTFLADDNLVTMLSSAIGNVKLQVAASDAERAVAILQQYREAQPEPPDDPDAEVYFNCQECGEPIAMPADRRGHVEVCPHCGEYVDVPE